MPRPRVYKTQAIVLRQRKLGEADKIVTLYCSHNGKIDAVAKGVRRTKSRLAGHLEPLTLGSYLLAEGRELDIITQAETIDAFPALRGDLERLSRGLYCAELVDRMTSERSEGAPIFRRLQTVLAVLSTATNIDLAVRHFEMALLEELGYRPLLESCAVCSRRLEPVTNYWSPAEGGVVCPGCSDQAQAMTPISVNGLKVLRLLQSAPFDQASRLRLSGELSAELERCLQQQVHFVLDREVRSARFVETLRFHAPASRLGE
jgi:DNA repair protein RecO (recombination protein O)